MTEQQLIKYLKKKKDIAPFISVGTKFVTPNIQKIRARINAKNLIQLLKVRKQIPSFEIIKQVQIAALDRSPQAIEYIQNPTQEMIIKAVSKDGSILRDIKNPSYEIQKRAIKNYRRRIGYIDNPSQQLQLMALNILPHAIQEIKNPSQTVINFAKEKGKKTSGFKSYIKKRKPQLYDIMYDSNRLKQLAGL